MNACIFSTYSKGENRITSSIMAVLSRLPINYSERLISALLQQPELELIKFKNQASKGASGVPDACISAHFDLYIETKTKLNSIINADQINRHLQRFEASAHNKFLLVLTPDMSCPRVIIELQNSENPINKQLIWSSFSSLDQAINELLLDSKEVVSDRDTFLLKQLQIMMYEENLLPSEKDVLVIAARNAWPEYQRYHAYVCQPNRFFQDVRYMAFYCEGEIKPLVAKIIDQNLKDSVIFDVNAESGKYQEVVKQMIADGVRKQGDLFKIILLSPPGHPDTKDLERSIPNDLESNNGRTIAFTQGQRYVKLKNLKNAKSTKELVN